MHKINGFVFSQNPEDIIEAAINVGKNYKIYDHEVSTDKHIFAISTVNESLADYLHENYLVRYYKEIQYGEPDCNSHYYQYINRCNMGFSIDDPYPIYSIVTITDMLKFQYYVSIPSAEKFAKCLRDKFGIECHLMYEHELILANTINHYKDMK